MHQFMNVNAFEKQKINLAWHDANITFKNNLKYLKNNSTAGKNFMNITWKWGISYYITVT